MFGNETDNPYGSSICVGPEDGRAGLPCSFSYQRPKAGEGGLVCGLHEQE